MERVDPSAEPRPLVVLLHGLARRHTSMARMAAHLRRAGWDTWARSYPSRSQPIEALATQITDWLLAAAGQRPLYAITHSMGGIVLRHLAHPSLRWQRAVMLAPPNQGSSLAAGLIDNPFFGWFFGPAGRGLATQPPSWPPPPAAFAVIAGTRRFALHNPTSWTIGRRFARDEANDGTVAVRETKLDGMAAFAELDVTHTWIMNDARVQLMSERFLRVGALH
jgi:triacylglycerol lipase